MAESIVKVPLDPNMDYDFIAFSFKGKNSYDDFGLYRTSDGDRYNTDLTPEAKDITAEVPGGDGAYYFGSTYTQRQFPINFAFDHLEEEKFREMKEWLNSKEMGDLWFAETPYKVYTAKPQGRATLKTICFEENGKRIYKGEGSVTFVAYWPYAHTPDFVQQPYIEIDSTPIDGYSDGYFSFVFKFANIIKKVNSQSKLYFLCNGDPNLNQKIQCNFDSKNFSYSSMVLLERYEDDLVKDRPGIYFACNIPDSIKEFSEIVLHFMYRDNADEPSRNSICKQDFLIYSGYDNINNGTTNKASQLLLRPVKVEKRFSQFASPKNYKLLETIYEKNEPKTDSPYTKIDGKAFLAYRGFSNYTAYKESVPLPSLIGTSNLYSYGDIPYPLVIEYTFNSAGNAKLWIGPTDKTDSDDHILEVSVRDVLVDDKIVWDTKTGIITRTRDKETIMIPYTGTSCGVLPPQTTLYADGYPKTYKYHYWYY